jgi:hypothetical protein
MTRNELIQRLMNLRDGLKTKDQTSNDLDITDLIDDINTDGVLDVQCPPEIAESMNLPRPADHITADDMAEAEANVLLDEATARDIHEADWK